MSLSRTLGFLSPQSAAYLSIRRLCLFVLRRHLSVSHPALPPASLGMSSTMPTPAGTSLELGYPSAYAVRKAHFFTPLRRSVWKPLPWLLHVPHPGFGYPLCGVSVPEPGESFSPPNARGFRSSEPFSSPVSCVCFRILRYVPALSHITPMGPCAGASTSCSHRRSRAPGYAPEGLVRVGASCSPELSDLLGVPLARPMK